MIRVYIDKMFTVVFCDNSVKRREGIDGDRG